MVLDKRCLHNVSRIIAGNAVAFGRKSCDVSSQHFRYCAKREKGTQRERGVERETLNTMPTQKKRFLSSSLLLSFSFSYRENGGRCHLFSQFNLQMACMSVVACTIRTDVSTFRRECSGKERSGRKNKKQIQNPERK